MPSLPRSVLMSKLKAALPRTTSALSPRDELTPARFRVPRLGSIVVYLWTLTPDHSRTGRPPGEHKIQMIVSGQQPGTRGRLSLRPGALTILLGYSPDYGVFAGWEAALYPRFGYSRNVQVGERLLDEARETGWAVGEPRRVRTGVEVRVAFSPGNLMKFLKLTKQAERQRLCGVEREGFFVSAGTETPAGTDPAEYVRSERTRVLTTRLSRERKFAPGVRAQFDDACAVCGAQLDIVQAAHIIPVSEEDGTDEYWNGLALCPNHHVLLDSRLILIASNLLVVLDAPIIEFLKQEGRGAGAEDLLTRHEGLRITPPSFWERDRVLRRRMQQALRRRLKLAGYTTV